MALLPGLPNHNRMRATLIDARIRARRAGHLRGSFSRFFYLILLFFWGGGGRAAYCCSYIPDQETAECPQTQ